MTCIISAHSNRRTFVKENMEAHSAIKARMEEKGTKGHRRTAGRPLGLDLRLAPCTHCSQNAPLILPQLGIEILYRPHSCTVLCSVMGYSGSRDMDVVCHLFPGWPETPPTHF